MRVAWFTPFSQASAIGKYSNIATKYLSKYAHVELFVVKADKMHETTLKKNYYDRNSNLTERLSEFDLIIYNFGDNLLYHLDIYEQAKKHRGIAILHDLIMHNFFRGYYLVDHNNVSEYIDSLNELYGEKVAQRGLSYFNNTNGEDKPFWETDEILKYTYLEKIYEIAEGIVTHSEYLLKRVQQDYNGPSTLAYFPFEADVFNGNDYPEEFKRNKINLLTVGNVNPNKRVDKIIKILGKNSMLREKINYVMVGSLSNVGYVEKVKAMIQEYNLEESVQLLGYRDDSSLFSYLTHADITANLRYPAMEGASWSLVEQMNFGRPILVTDTGFYKEMADNCVCKIKVEDEENDLVKWLDKLVKDESLRLEIGESAKLFALEKFEPTKYCNKITNFGSEVLFNRPLNALINRLSYEMKVMDVKKRMAIVDELSSEMEKLFYK